MCGYAMARVRVNCKQCGNFPGVVRWVTGGVGCLPTNAELKSMWNYVCANGGLVLLRIAGEINWHGGTT